jgi:redox-sensitive bicupin YhaK (pirin superfamily)
MKTIVHKAESRGFADHGWLKAKHSFSFANYYHPEKIHFGVLRVLNDDTIAPGAGFSTHPHDNMEIITIPLSGKLAHKDSMGNASVISTGEVQVMSAGTGIFHSEYNYNKDKELQLFQIWMFPKIKNVEPRYDLISIKDIEKENDFFQILSPNKDDQGVWVYQDAWFSLGNFTKAVATSYTVKKSGNGVYIMVIDGQIQINGHDLKKRDAIGITHTSEIEITIMDKAQLLLMDIPMTS